ncbi:TIGR03943 family putative permease subunit [Streptomyces chartreusis]|uniref:TIGR03943 family putative permease subunit n=1 Tax=Streptomyces chartreusis TaxID=1969 RepID=UPI00364131F0
MGDAVNRQAQAAVLFLLGASLLHAATTDLYLRYVKQGLRPLVLVSGAVLIAAALATAWYERKRARSRKRAHAGHTDADHPDARNRRADHPAAEDPRAGHTGAEDSRAGHTDAEDSRAGHTGARNPRAGLTDAEDPRTGHTDVGDPRAGHPDAEDPRGEHTDARNPDAEHPHTEHTDADHVHPEPRISWLLVLPLLALILVAPPALGSYSATRTGTALQEPLAYPALPAADPLPLDVVDYAGRAVYDHGRTLHDRRIQLTGFLALDRDGTPYLVRMALNCCAADAQPVKVALTGQVPPVLQPDTWLRVTGTYTARRTKDPVNGGPIPFIEVTEAKPVAEPTDPYDESWNG